MRFTQVWTRFSNDVITKVTKIDPIELNSVTKTIIFYL